MQCDVIAKAFCTVLSVTFSYRGVIILRGISAVVWKECHMQHRHLSGSPRSSGIISLVCTALLALLCTSCIRYTPSRAELEKKQSKDGPGLSLAGEAEFVAYEAKLSDRLQKLVASRAQLLSQSPTQAGYSVGTGDIIQVNVYGFSDLQTEAEVSPRGTVSLPLIGETDVGGLDVSDLRQKLASEYGKYIRSPKIDVSLKAYQANRISVIGEVAKPGIYPLRRRGQLLTELLSEAGGRTQLASNRMILLPAPTILSSRTPDKVEAPPTLRLATSETPTTYGVEIELESLIGSVDQRPLLVPLLPGDTIVVPEAGHYEVDGEVATPGSYKLAARTSAIGAIAAAGGFTYAANVNQVEVVRDIGAGRKAFLALDLEEVGLRGGRDIRLRDGDLVRVPSEPNRFFRRQIVEALNGLFNGFGVSKRVN
jgi:polysaccharide export outer membrane protein